MFVVSRSGVRPLPPQRGLRAGVPASLGCVAPGAAGFSRGRFCGRVPAGVGGRGRLAVLGGVGGWASLSRLRGGPGEGAASGSEVGILCGLAGSMDRGGRGSPGCARLRVVGGVGLGVGR